MPTQKHIGDQCMKCAVGHFDVMEFIPDVRVATRGGGCCTDCPAEEHLHLSCTKCCYIVWDQTAEQKEQEEQSAKLS